MSAARKTPSTPSTAKHPSPAGWKTSGTPRPAGVSTVAGATRDEPLVAPPSLAAPGVGSGARRQRLGPASQRPPRLYARSCALTDLLPPAVRRMLKDEIGQRLERHFEAPQWEYPNWLFENSEIVWGQQAQWVYPGRALRRLPLKGKAWGDGLLWLLLAEAERLARLVVERRPEHSRHERAACMLGALRRIGQIYRELRWRCGEARALWHVRVALGSLFWW